ncbi:MAG: hypothetical protein AMJ46_04090 [Latescibacteria bacterium DG_63]|nr:MAG: hypothetical protein AMJ46_04090 [Latescibacteria bacterium DG_63]
MKGKLLIVATVVLILALCVPPAWAAQDFLISCEGTESGGGGANRYQYTLQNISGSPITLTEFFVGTGDAAVSSYTFIPTPGFTVSIIPNDGYPPCNVTYTSGVKTPHGVVPPPSGFPSAAVIYWIGSTVVSPSGTVTFAFNHPGPSNDHEWFANSSAGWTISQVDQPMAGPTGVYTIGYVHAPNPPPVIPAVSGWRLVLFIALPLLVAAWLLLRRKRRTSTAA